MRGGSAEKVLPAVAKVGGKELQKGFGPRNAGDDHADGHPERKSGEQRRCRPLAEVFPAAGNGLAGLSPSRGNGLLHFSAGGLGSAGQWSSFVAVMLD